MTLTGMNKIAGRIIKSPTKQESVYVTEIDIVGFVSFRLYKMYKVNWLIKGFRPLSTWVWRLCSKIPKYLLF